MLSLIIGVFFAILNETLLNVAYVQLMKDFEVTASTIQWLTTGFLLVVGILIPITALILQWFTTRQIFLGAMSIFAVGTLICAFAPNFSILFVGRLVQAIGTGLLIPVMMNTVLVLFPKEKRGSAMGMVSLVIMVAPAIGPTLSGIIVEMFHWRFLFFFVLPFIVFSLVFAFIYLKNITKLTKPKVDIPSIVFSTLGFGGIVFGFSQAGKGTAGWSHPEVYLFIAMGVISLIVFVKRQLQLKEPILDVRAFRFPMFTLATILTVVLMMTLFSSFIILPLFLQQGLFLTAFATGLAFLPGGILNGIISQMSGRLFDKFGPRALVIPGSTIVVIVMFFFSKVTILTSVTTFIILHCSLMLGVALIMTPVQTNGLNQLPPKYYPHGAAIINTLVQVAGAIGIAVFVTVMSSSQMKFLEGVSGNVVANQAEALIAGVQNVFAIGLVFASICFLLALFIKSPIISEELDGVEETENQANVAP
ncbi:MDR family MFS transporter [Halalkalibacter kiskunsagensis]|uniref:MDR family MFS transporter n=1 Tax=Halalkalibacter kiskunsagensis TaxID=1548599 RepID=A0ABV6KA45_9BACI